MDTTKLGFDIFDIRDFFDKNFVDEYEEVTINARKYFKTTIKNVLQDYHIWMGVHRGSQI